MSSSRLDRFEQLLQSKATAQEPEFKVALAHLASEVKQRLRKGSPASADFITATIRALSRLKGIAHAEMRMSCLFDSGMFLLTNGFGSEALNAAHQLERLAERSGWKAWIRKASNLSGMVNADLGNVADAVIHYSTSVDLAREIGSGSGECSALINLGVALNYGGLHREAIPCLKYAAALSKTEAVEADCAKTGIRPSELQAASLTNLAQSHLYLEEFENGLAAISECLRRSEEPIDAITSAARAVREYTFVQLALELGKLELARTHRDLCCRYASAGGRQAAQVAAISSGLCEVYGGDTQHGIELLETLVASDFDSGSVRIATLNALVRAYDAVGNPERGLECLSELLELVRATREKGVIAILSLPHAVGPASHIAQESDDLRALRYKEAQLRTKVAENAALNARIEILERLAVAADLKEESSGEHGYRVGALAALMGGELNWSRQACLAIEMAARLHDVGKIGVPDRILLNTKELKEAERHFVNTHTVIGSELLAKSDIPQLRLAQVIALYHHEWWNGTGYPSKLSAKRIPIHARIVALADVFDALTHGRPFAPAWPIERALEEIQDRRGTQFDPELTDLFLKLVDSLRAVHLDLDAYLGKAGGNSAFLQARNKIRSLLAEEREQERKATATGSETRH